MVSILPLKCNSKVPTKLVEIILVKFKEHIKGPSRTSIFTIKCRYDETLQAVKEPNFGCFVQDNILRLLLNRISYFM